MQKECIRRTKEKAISCGFCVEVCIHICKQACVWEVYEEVAKEAKERERRDANDSRGSSLKKY